MTKTTTVAWVNRALIRWLGPIAIALLWLGLSGCAQAGGSPAATPEPTQWLQQVAPMSAADGAAYLSIANDQGVTPCAVFNASWGHWIGQLPDDVPTCAAQGLAVTVMCLDSSAQWAADNVKNLQFEEIGPGGSPIMQFDLTQDGVCGVFPKASSQ